MESSPPSPSSQTDPSSTETVADALTREGEIPLELCAESGSVSGYSVLVRGEVQVSSILSSTEPDGSVTVLENDTKLLAGTLAGETVGFVINGTILAAEFDEPAPTVKVGGAFVDAGRWPTVTEYTGHGPGEESVEDPFPNSAELGAYPGDPLNPDEYVIELDANGLDEPDAYCFDIEGDVIDHSEGVTVSDSADRLYGCLQPGCRARIEVGGFISRIDTAEGIEFTVRARETGVADAE